MAPTIAQAQSRHRRRNREETEKELELAILRVKDKGSKLSISAVATEAGVTAGLIHNTYPDIAKKIRTATGRDIRQQRDAMAAKLRAVRVQMKALRAERTEALADVGKLASINETLRLEVATLRATASGKVVVLAG
jgi:hypothetical protein